MPKPSSCSKLRYVAYCRKSTDEPDRQILSIEAQVAELKEFAAKEKLHIVSYIEESKTAKEPGRKQFAQMLQLIEQGKADAILSWHPDRLARNSVDGGKIIYLLDTGHLLDLKFPSFWFENTPQGKFMLGMAFNQSKYYVDNLSENVKRGNRQKLRRGEWPNKAPFGYLNDRITKQIIVDEVRSPFVVEAFKMFATGNFGYKDIQRFWTKNNIKNRSGKVVHCDKVKRILSDPFYFGLMRFCGELFEGKHQPLISKKLFDEIQSVIPTKNKSHIPHTHDFPFIGFIKCGECGGAITCETHTKHYSRTERSATYVYYRCSKKKGACSQYSFSPSLELEQQLRDALLKVSLPTSTAKKFLQWGERDAQLEISDHASLVEQTTRQLQGVDSKLSVLLDGYLEKVIEPDVYKEKKNELIRQKLQLQQQLEDIKKKGSDWLEPFSKFVKDAAQAAKIARGNYNCSELAFFTKLTGSNFLLKDRNLSIVYKKQGWLALAMSAGMACATTDNSCLLPD